MRDSEAYATSVNNLRYVVGALATLFALNAELFNLAVVWPGSKYRTASPIFLAGAIALVVAAAAWPNLSAPARWTIGLGGFVYEALFFFGYPLLLKYNPGGIATKLIENDALARAEIEARRAGQPLPSDKRAYKHHDPGVGRNGLLRAWLETSAADWDSVYPSPYDALEESLRETPPRFAMGLLAQLRQAPPGDAELSQLLNVEMPTEREYETALARIEALLVRYSTLTTE